MGSGQSVPAGTPFTHMKFVWSSVRSGTQIQLQSIKLYTSDSKEHKAISCSSGSDRSPGNEGPSNLIKTDSQAKWFCGELDFVEIELGKETCITHYELVTANDCIERDPKAWKVYAKRGADGKWIEGASVNNFKCPKGRYESCGRMPFGNVDSAALELAKKEELKEKNGMILTLCDKFSLGAPKPNPLPSPKIKPDWFYEAAHYMYEISTNGESSEDLSFPLINWGPKISENNYKGLYRLFKISQDEGTSRPQNLLSSAASLSTRESGTNTLLKYSDYFGCLHPSHLCEEAGDFKEFLDATVFKGSGAQTCYSKDQDSEFVVDLGKNAMITEAGFTYTPWDRNCCTNMIVYVGEDENSMKKVGSHKIPKSPSKAIADKVQQQFGFDIHGDIGRLEPLFRDSTNVYNGCLDQCIAANPAAMEAIRHIKEIIPETTPLQPGKPDDHEGVWANAALAQEEIKRVVAEGSDWAESVKDQGWAEAIDNASGCAPKHTSSTEQRCCNDGTVSWLDKAYDPHIKSKVRGMEKVHYKYNGNFCRLRDIARLALQFETAEKMVVACEQLSTKFEVLQLENRFQHPTPLGWRDISILAKVDLPNGSHHIVELQLHLLPFVAARMKAHEHYEKIRSILPEICKCPPEQLDRVQYCIIDNLKSTQAVDRGDPWTNFLNCVLCKFDAVKGRFVKLVFEDTWRNGEGQRFHFLHLHGPGE